jgi:heme a synthase
LATLRAYTVAARLGLSTSLAIFILIVIGSVVRTTGSGLACPDWPLCQGHLIPPFQFNVLIEWLHRTVALVVSLLLLSTAAWVLFHRELRARLGGLAGLAVGLLAVQVLLGALTVWKLLQPSVVSSHLAVALLLFVTVLALTLAAESGTEARPALHAAASRPPGLLPLFGLVTTLCFAQAVSGAVVSSRHAGLACPDWPGCNGVWFPPLDSLAGIQMFHRYGAYVLTFFTMLAAFLARTAPDAGVRAGAGMALGLVAIQLLLGVCNVLLGTPPWISALHLATAAAMLAMLVVTTYRIALLPARASSWTAVTVP